MGGERGQEMPWSRADCTMVRPPSATAAPAVCRSRVVSREWAGTWATCSVND
ncbi:hypothetical protein ACGFIT_22700 [Micromonospora tulbaghiae]|uniref:hypothetical protein n=1 Tax=Micromonospora tulbaghiae TaxID=479978 RepID=UPI003722F397